MRYAATRKHRPIGLHFVVSALIRMHGQFGGALGPRKRCPKRARDEFEDGASCYAVRDDLAVIAVHTSRQIELVPVHVELCDICHLLLAGSTRQKVALQDIGHVHIAHAWNSPRALFALINARSPILCISRCTHLWLTGSAIDLLSVAVIRL